MHVRMYADVEAIDVFLATSILEDHEDLLNARYRGSDTRTVKAHDTHA